MKIEDLSKAYMLNKQIEEFKNQLTSIEYALKAERSEGAYHLDKIQLSSSYEPEPLYLNTKLISVGELLRRQFDITQKKINGLEKELEKLL